MNRVEQMYIKAHITDTLVHKATLLSVAQKMVEYLFENERGGEAIELAKRCFVHDNSKLESEELYNFAELMSQTKDSKRKPLTDNQKKLIELHWKNNRHHPEYHKHQEDMTEIDIMEMCCDWYARTVQFKTNFMEIVEAQQNERFHFDEETYKKIKMYCQILVKN